MICFVGYLKIILQKYIMYFVNNLRDLLIILNNKRIYTTNFDVDIYDKTCIYNFILEKLGNI